MAKRRYKSNLTEYDRPLLMKIQTLRSFEYASVAMTAFSGRKKKQLSERLVIIIYGWSILLQSLIDPGERTNRRRQSPSAHRAASSAERGQRHDCHPGIINVEEREFSSTENEHAPRVRNCLPDRRKSLRSITRREVQRCAREREGAGRRPIMN